MKTQTLLFSLLLLISSASYASRVSHVEYSYSEHCDDVDVELVRADLEAQCQAQGLVLLEMDNGACLVSDIGDYITTYGDWFDGTCGTSTED